MIPFAAAAGAVLGAFVAWPVAWPIIAVAVAAAMKWRQPVLIALALFLLTATMADRAMTGLVAVESADFDGWVTLAEDPRPLGQSGVGFTVRSNGRLIDVTAHGPQAARLSRSLAGERVWIRGRMGPVRESDSWSKWRHVVGRLSVDEVVGFGEAAPVSRFVNGIRRTLVSGAGAMPAGERALFLGMVIGDDRGQFAVTADDFRAAGLGHLLVVSGQNVAFVLALVGPLVSRFRPGPRLAILIGLLAAFALLTRFEPSVLRATVMAGVSVGGMALDLDVDGRKALALAVAVLLVIDPFLVHRVGFQLSVCATAGIVWMSTSIAERLRGPTFFRVALSTTVSAQLAVAPVLLATFGPMPLASLPANVLAEPIAGPVMMWGSTGGLVAGVVGGLPATVIHLPTRALLWWIQGVARVAAAAPTAMLGGMMLVLLSGSLWAAIQRVPSWRIAGVLVMAMVMVVSVTAAPTVAIGRSDVGAGVVVWHHDDTIVVMLDNPRGPRQVLESLRVAGVREIDLVIASRGNRSDSAVVRSIYDRFGDVAVAAPPMHRVPGAHAVMSGRLIEVGEIQVEVIEIDPKLEIRVARASPDGG